jgi:cytochrome d ubiquinol oxidase subunit II
METLWFCIVAVMIAAYVVFDGFDLGAGAIHLLAARTGEERAQLLASIGPVWDGNEVWLIAGGGALYFAFPPLYAAAFSGFYLPLMIVLWLLILRGISIEFRNHIEGDMWKPFWDVVFAWSSGILALLLGAALGNVVRGVPLDRDGFFFLPLWTNFLPGPQPGIVDWYTLLTGLAAVAALAMHGSLWVAMKTDGPVQARAQVLASRSCIAVVLMTIAVTIASFSLQPHLAQRFGSHPEGFLFPAIALAGLAGVFFFHRNQQALQAFLASSAYLVGMLTSLVFGIYPYVLPSNTDPTGGLSIYNAAAPRYGLEVGLWWFAPGITLVAAYFVFAYSHHRGKIPNSPS